MSFSTVVSRIFLTLGIVSFSLSFALPVQAAQFVQPDDAGNVSFNKLDQENIYGAGSQVTVSQRVINDAVVAGETINVTKDVDVTGGILAAGQQLNITPRTVGSSVRAVGQTIVLSGFVRKDAVLAGQTVTLKNVKIGGDLVVSANNIIVEDNVIIQGKIYASTSSIKGTLTNVSGKDITIQTTKNEDFSSVVAAAAGINWFAFVYSTFGSVVVLAALIFFLSKKNVLQVSQVAFNNIFGKDLLLGSLVFFLTIPIIAIAFVFTVGLQLLPLVFILYGLWSLLGIYFSIYAANFVRNTFNLSFNFKYLVAALFVVNIVFSFIPFINAIWGIIWFIFSLAQFGFALRTVYSSLKKSLNTEVV